MIDAIRSFSLLFFISIAVSCSEDKNNADSGHRGEDAESRDLADIQKEGVLRAITIYSNTNYFLYRGAPMGYEYELIKRLADYLGLELEMVVARDIQEMFDFLYEGKGDLIASGLTITNERKLDVRFTDYLYLTKQVLIQRKPKDWMNLKKHQIDAQLIKDPIDLINDTVHVTKNSSYYKRLTNLEEEMGGNIHIKVVDGELSTEKLIAMVVNGKITYTVSDKSIADINASYYPILDVSTPLSFSQRIAWALNKESTHLTDTINFWINKMKKYNAYYTIYDKYFKSSRSFKKRIKSDFYSEKTGKISPYDELIKNAVEPIGWDWLLISSLIYQESHFDPNAESWANANGLMQLMPGTAEELGVKDITDPVQSINGGVKYLKSIWNQWESITDSVQRFKFTFASYNCGIHHLFDAQKLAERDGLDPTVWDGNVEAEILKLTHSKYYRDPLVKYGYVRGKEPVNYVKEIFQRYDQYKSFISMNSEK